MTATFQLLGDVAAAVDGQPTDLGHARQRCVLAVLLIEVNRAVSADQLLDRVWAERPPHRARNVLSGYLSRLRQALAGAEGVRITRQPGGYVLATDPATIDLHRFRDLVAAARAVDEPTDTIQKLGEALRLWRGEPFAALDTPWLNGVRDALEAERHAAELDRNDLALRSGRHAAVLTEILTAAERHPLDERLAAQLMLAFYRNGRQADALATFRVIRDRLIEELGADPGASLLGLHRQILDGDPELLAVAPERLTPARPAASVPRQLPAPPRMFAGREAELAELDDLLSDACRPSAVLITAISGTGGIGKTALALTWAHRVADRFPDGQLYINLRGFDPTGTVVEPGEAVRALLEALGVDPQHVPSTFDAQVGLYRSLLADRRILVVLDNARDDDQLRPLLPSAPGCLAVVTSRNLLGGLVVTEGAVPLGLDLLSRDEAWSLLAGRLGMGRLDAEPHAVEQIITACGRLPLALAVVAARAVTRRGASLGALADELGEVRERLDALQIGDPATDVRAVFSWSYRALAADAARLFRLLSLHPGPDISPCAAASLAGAPEREVRRSLAVLGTANLLTEQEHGRYSFHDLLRAYAFERADTDETAEERQAASARMRDHYLHTADLADSLIYPPRDPVDLPPARAGATPEGLTDVGGAIAWFTRESSVLLGTARQAELEDDGSSYPGLLLWTMVNYLDRRGLWLDWLDVQRRALQTATAAADPRGRAVAHRGLEHALLRLGHQDEAGTHGRCALALYRQLRDRAGEAQTHLALGLGAAGSGDLAAGLGHFLEALTLYESIGHEAGRANALNNAGYVYVMLGEYEKALGFCARAVEMSESVGDGQLLGYSWDSLGFVHQNLGHHEQAIGCYENALAFVREYGDRYAEAETLTHLGDTHALAGDLPQACAAWTLARAVYEELGRPEADRLGDKLQATAVPADPPLAADDPGSSGSGVG